MYEGPEDDKIRWKNKEDVMINIDESQSIEESEIISLEEKRPNKSKNPLKKKIKLDEFS